MSAMFGTKLLERMLNPHGLTCRAQVVPLPERTAFPDLNVPVERITAEETWYELTFAGRTPGPQSRDIWCTVVLPFPDSVGGVFQWGDRERVVVSRCFPDITADPGVEAWGFDRMGRVLVRELQQIFASALRDFYFTGNPPSSAALRSRLTRLFTSSKWCPVLPVGTVGRESLRELIYMDLPETLDLETLRFPEKLRGILDPCSTSNGNKINRVYRLCQGASIGKNGKVDAEGSAEFCSTIANNAIGIDLAPHRVNTLRTSFEAALDLVDPEDPWVCGELHGLQGVHLLTALMDWKWSTWEDAIAISASAAQRLKAVRRTQEVVETFSPLEIKVQEGDSVMPGGHLLGVGLSREGRREPFVSTRLHHPGWVEKITACRTHVLGRPAVRYRFHIVSYIDAQTGDKVTTRAGTKGVVKIIPDAQMPRTQDGARIEACVSPVSVYGRKALLVPWEMMANKRQAGKGERLIYPHLQQLRKLKPTFRQLASWGMGSSEQLYLKSHPLPYQTFTGPLYFVRLDKIAHEIASVQKGKRKKNHHGIPVDSARLSGQRRDLGKAMAMSARNLHECLAHSIRQDVSGTDHVRRIASALEGRYIRSRPEEDEGDRVAEDCL